MPMSRLCGGTSLIGRPSSMISPRVALSKPASIIRAVVLPEPEGPSSVRNSPRREVEVQAFDDQRLAVIALLHVVELDVRLVRHAVRLPARVAARPPPAGATLIHRRG